MDLLFLIILAFIGSKLSRGIMAWFLASLLLYSAVKITVILLIGAFSHINGISEMIASPPKVSCVIAFIAIAGLYGLAIKKQNCSCSSVDRAADF